ncbi:HlyD family secretion protein [Solimonas terrae]|uniref:HlyD family secretion protein n=1 Tax=Solimonas terrae TaxID=1396819 RepID=A0A6M2BQP1_9GAMM|nr:HlyD family secretion protein [Solimonas terrae]NGY04942.1 HlyD family secretion protein [Solimonas terrae]
MSEQSESAVSPQRQRVRRILFVAGFAVAIAAVLYVYIFGGRYVSTDNAYVKANMVNVSADVDGKVAEIDVSENQHVKAGDVLFRIDPAPYQVAVQQAEAALLQASAQVESLKATYAQKQAALWSAQADLTFRETDYRRAKALQAVGASSKSTLDAARNALDVARSDINAARHEVGEVRAQLGGDPEIATKDHPTYKAALATLDKARLDLARTAVHTPIDGVASKVPDVGGYVLPGLPVMSVVDAESPWVEANLKESQLERVRPGQKVEIDVDAYSHTRWQGVVDSIGQATGAEFSLLPPQNASGNWVKVVQRVPVRIRIDHQNGEPPLRSGMSADISIDTGAARARGVHRMLSWIGLEDAQAAE